MSYNEQLKRLIASSGMTINEIAKRCEQYGEKISPQYITNLKNSRNKSASESVSIAIAKACNAENSDILAIEGYVDRAPKYIKEFFEDYRDEMLTTTVSIYKSQLSDEEFHRVEEALANMTMAEFIVAMKKYKEMQTKTPTVEIQQNKDNFKIVAEIAEVHSVTAKDDAMQPLILKGGKAIYVKKEISEYQNGDIVCFTLKGKREELIRKCVFSEDRKKVTMLPINPEFLTETYNIDNINFIGKTKKFVFEV